MPTPNLIEYQTTTLGALGPRLPVGIPIGPQYVRDIEIRPFKLLEEKQIGEFRARAQALTMGKLVSHILATLCPRLGPHQLAEMKMADRLLAISQMDMGDVLYAYIYTRVHALGPEMEIGFECPMCRHTYQTTFNLNDVDVKILENDAVVDRTFDYELRDGLETRGKTFHTLTLGPIPWWGMDSPELEGMNGLNPALRDQALLRAGIMKADGEPIQATDKDLDEMTVYDKSGLMDALSHTIPGPQLIVETSCNKCTQKYWQQLEWSYDVFFKRFSRSLAGKS